MGGGQREARVANDYHQQHLVGHLERSRYGVELDKDGNVKNLNKKLNYRSQKSNTSSFRLESFRWLTQKIWE